MSYSGSFSLPFLLPLSPPTFWNQENFYFSAEASGYVALTSRHGPLETAGTSPPMSRPPLRPSSLETSPLSVFKSDAHPFSRFLIDEGFLPLCPHRTSDAFQLGVFRSVPLVTLPFPVSLVF